MSSFLLLLVVIVIVGGIFAFMLYRQEAEKRARLKKRNQYNDRV